MKSGRFMRLITIALAYVGVIVGAGFASGQEAFQYYVAFGREGIFALILSCFFFAMGGYLLLVYGFRYSAEDHRIVFDKISSPIIAKLIDLAINLSLFLIGFVMIAGAGTNLKLIFSLPTWVGSILLTVLLILTAFLDTTKVTQLIGAITPFVLILIIGASIYTLMASPIPFSEALDLAQKAETSLPNWWVSAINYTSLGIMTCVSMAIVIGGNQESSFEAGLGGILGGLVTTILQAAAYITIVGNIQRFDTNEMPMLMVLDDIHPLLGAVMGVVVFGMIFNTAIGMFYPLAKRFSYNQPQRVPKLMIPMVLVGLGLSAFGFTRLVSYVYPFIGYLGVFVFLLLLVQFIRHRDDILHGKVDLDQSKN
ncbi:hypothetical protein ODY58_03015 [Aerococcus sp. JJEM-2022b]|uniref:YkvI family membrane protein n=1 Tax=Aerococcus mictus TaxID=2976810 RepID=UPI00227CAB13|nr:hypothetical protein [Aerococcus mictus]MCY3077927.1 hypothetical protein [Aerococcus mictus]